jgi:hypothetical protein
MSIVAFASGKPQVPLDEAVRNLECMLGFKARAVYHKSGLRGLAAQLSTPQLNRLQRTALFKPILVERGTFLLRPNVQDPEVAEQRIAALERSIGFTVDVRFNRGYFRGWGADLDWRQLALLEEETDIGVTQNPSSYVVWFDHLAGEAAVQRTAELEQKYGFRSTFVFTGLGAFAAGLTNTQLAALSGEPDLETYHGGDGVSIWLGGPPHVTCLRASPRVRRDLARALKRSPWKAGTIGPVGRVLRARLERTQGELGQVIITEYALATFRARLGTFTELYERRNGRWKDVGRLPGTVCNERVPAPLLEAWLFRPVSPYGCYATN